jgi:hypothetical protein
MRALYPRLYLIMEKLSTFQSVRFSFDHSFNVSLLFHPSSLRSRLRTVYGCMCRYNTKLCGLLTFDSNFLISSDFRNDFPECVLPFFSLLLPFFFILSSRLYTRAISYLLFIRRQSVYSTERHSTVYSSSLRALSHFQRIDNFFI